MKDSETKDALRERIKELTCLYGIAKVVDNPDSALDEKMQSIVELLPPAWQYPEIASSRITIDDQEYTTRSHQGEDKCSKLSSDIVVNNVKRGAVDVVYHTEQPKQAAFLIEERKLLDEIARQVALVIERKQADEDKKRLQEQILHADRLATIGQLSAGVAHEINEPLGNILGFAQLAKKDPILSEQTSSDLEKIIKATLHAREVIKKLLIFAHQLPDKKTEGNLNHIVDEGLYFLESRCQKEGILLDKILAPDLPDIVLDAPQLNQVLVNLVVNAIHAMPGGGTLTVKTTLHDSYISLIIKDTGIGMTEEVMKNIFIPFFTTKEVGQGTGLGLSVVHGIVTNHGGTIHIESILGKGTLFEVRLPLHQS